MSPLGRLRRFLRSPRIAVALIIAVGALSAVGTLPGQEEWYTSPFYLLPLTWLTLSTAVCAWERSSRARSLSRDPGAITEALLGRLQSSPQATCEIPGGSTETVAEALRTIGLKTRSGPSMVVGQAGRLGLVGSPLFHWSLVALFVAIALGQLTVSSGLMGVPLGEAVPEAEESYGLLDTGPLFPGHTQHAIAVVDWQRSYVVGGVERGPVPTVEVRDQQGRLLGSRPVYANNPLRSGAMIVHMNGWGLAPGIAIGEPDGQTVLEDRLIVDFDPMDAAATQPAVLEYADDEGRLWELTLRLEPPAEGNERSTDETVPADAIVTAGVEGTEPSHSARLAAGESFELPDGRMLTYLGTTYYARLSVVRDWSLYPIYALITLATIGLALSLLLPHRVAWVLVSGEGSDTTARVVTRHIRRDAVFVEAVAAAIGEHHRKETSP